MKPRHEDHSYGNHRESSSRRRARRRARRLLDRQRGPGASAEDQPSDSSHVSAEGGSEDRAAVESQLGELLDGAALRALDPGQAVRRVQQVKGLGPFAARRGGPTAPGPPSTCVRCRSSAPARSPAAEPPGSPDTLSDHALNY
jgi:hypothetical protein